MNTENSLFEKINSWIQNSASLKLVTITVLMLLLLIPTAMITDIISEREFIQANATAEVSSKWADYQEINGPILTIPVNYEHVYNEEIVRSVQYWNILPENLSISSNANPKKLHRGIYEIIVYESDIKISGDFLLPELSRQTGLKRIAYDEAFITFGISDLRGIKNQVELEWGDKKVSVTPGSKIPQLIYSGVTVDLPDIEGLSQTAQTFSLALNLQGSGGISFVPLGKVTKVTMKSSWDSPSFTGNFLPDNRLINEDGFEANWSVLQLNRNFPQTWFGNEVNESISDAAFGVDLILPLDDYQKSMRSAKYGVMTIALTFLIFFLVEVLNKNKIHPFQYTLVGLALCLFYVLLVSISEHTSFNLAFLISTVATVFMIGLYCISVFRSLKFSIGLMVALLGIYGFLFVTLQLADYALLMGSIGLSLILGATMYFTRKIDWYNINVSKSNNIRPVQQ